MLSALLLQVGLIFGTCDDVPFDAPLGSEPMACVQVWEVEARTSDLCARMGNVDSDWWTKPEACDSYDRGVR